MAKTTIHRTTEAGQRYGRLVAIEAAEPGITPGGKSYSRWLCRCDCGAEQIVQQASLRAGRTQSCGCLQRESTLNAHLDHGASKTALYRLWVMMKQRCTNPKSSGFPHYGGRGISVCKRWVNSFTDFATDVGPRPYGFTLERINNNGNYEPGNVRWASRAEQAANTRKNVFVEWQGERLYLAEAARRAGISIEALHGRVRLGWTVDKIMTTPSQGRKRSG